MSTYIIPDVHGCLKTLKFLLEEKLQISPSDRIFMLGDYIDRGPDSPGTVDYIIRLIEYGYNINCLKGNHELLLLDSIGSSMYYNLWMINEGEETLKSYSKVTGIGHCEGNYSCIPEKHMDFYRSLPPYLIVDEKYVLVHGGLDFRDKDPFADERSMLWKRPEPIPDSLAPGKKIFYGHTVYSIDYIKSRLNIPDVRLIGLDAGCVFKGKGEGLGFLTAFKIDSWELTYVENIEDR
jgi:serine/threonine protein phosphatase 1